MKDPLEEAEDLKQKGNECFKINKYEDAIGFYSKAISLDVAVKKTVIYYANRAYCHIKMENYGLAITDCDEGIKLDPTYIKSYYRQGSAYLLLSKLEQAKANFTKANQLSNSKDDDILEKLKLVKELIFKKKFAEAIRKEEEEEEIKLTDIQVGSDYTGPRLSENEKVTEEWQKYPFYEKGGEFNGILQGLKEVTQEIRGNANLTMRGHFARTAFLG